MGEFFKELKKTFMGVDTLDLAAMLAFWSVLALFPFAIFVATVLGWIGLGAGITGQAVQIVQRFAPQQAAPLLSGMLYNVVRGSSWWLTVVGILGALWSAAGGVVSFATALNRAYGVEEHRSFLSLRLRAIIITIVSAILLIIAIAALLIGPQLVESAANFFGAGGVVVAVWKWLRWPVVVVGMMTMLAGLYYYCPDVKQPFKFVTPGSVIAILLWIGGSLLFNLYLKHFNTYNKTYGALGTGVVLLTWFLLSSLFVLLGGEVNAIIHRYSPETKKEPRRKRDALRQKQKAERALKDAERGHPQPVT